MGGVWSEGCYAKKDRGAKKLCTITRRKNKKVSFWSEMFHFYSRCVNTIFKISFVFYAKAAGCTVNTTFIVDSPLPKKYCESVIIGKIEKTLSTVRFLDDIMCLFI